MNIKDCCVKFNKIILAIINVFVVVSCIVKLQFKDANLDLLEGCIVTEIILLRY